VIWGVDGITPELERAAQGSVTVFGRGGMTTKLEAARAAARCGAATILCNGRKRDAILRAANGEETGTLFRAGVRIRSRKHWLAFTAPSRGELLIDAGAVSALENRGKSLLPAGIAEVRGDFGIGDVIVCRAPDERAVARGLAAYSSDDIRSIAGKETAKIQQVLGYSNGNEVIHRDDLVLLGDSNSSNAPTAPTVPAAPAEPGGAGRESTEPDA